MPALFNRPLDVKSWLATSLEAQAVLCRAWGFFRGLTRGQPHDGVRDGIPPCLMIAVRDGRGGRSAVIPTSSREGRELRRGAGGCADVRRSGRGRGGVCLERLFLAPHRVQDDRVLDNVANAGVAVA